MLSCLFIAALWSPAGKGIYLLALLYMMFSCVLSLSHVVSWVRLSIPDLCLLPYFTKTGGSLAATKHSVKMHFLFTVIGFRKEYETVGFCLLVSSTDYVRKQSDPDQARLILIQTIWQSLF